MAATGMRGLENRFYALIRHAAAASAASAEAADGAGMAALESAGYCLLVTYRRDGTPVPTPVWFAPHGEGIVFESDCDSAKIRRLRREPRVRVAPCNSRGRPLGPPVEAVARILDEEEAAAAERALAERYGLSRRIAQRLRSSPGHAYVEVRARD